MKDDSEDCFDSISIGIKQTQNSNLAIYEAIQQLDGLPIYYTQKQTNNNKNRNKQKYNNLVKYKITYFNSDQWQGCINSHILPAYS